MDTGPCSMPAAGSAKAPRCISDGVDGEKSELRSGNPGCPGVLGCGGSPGANTPSVPGNAVSVAAKPSAPARAPGETNAPTIGADGGNNGLDAGNGRSPGDVAAVGKAAGGNAAEGGGANSADRLGGMAARGVGAAGKLTDAGVVAIVPANAAMGVPATGVSARGTGATGEMAGGDVSTPAAIGAIATIAGGSEATWFPEGAWAACVGAAWGGGASGRVPSVASPAGLPRSCAAESSNAPDRNKRSVTRSTRWEAFGVSMTCWFPWPPYSNHHFRAKNPARARR